MAFRRWARVLISLSLAIAACDPTAAAPTQQPTSPPRVAATPITTVAAVTDRPPATARPTVHSSAAAALQALLDAERTDTGAPGAIAAVRRNGRDVFAASGAADI